MAAAGTANATTLLGPSSYLCFDNGAIAGCGAAESPFAPTFNAGGFKYFHLETFEDDALNTPGVAASAGSVIGPGDFNGFRDSVDEDTGTIDGDGNGNNTTNAHSWFANSGSTGITFTFSAATLGMLPTHVGIVWTDGNNNIEFEAFGPGNASLGTLGPVALADGNFAGGTAEDRFFGVIDAGGIESIFIKSGSPVGIEVDHLQYGRIPEPGTLALFGVGLAGLGFARRRKVVKHAD